MEPAQQIAQPFGFGLPRQRFPDTCKGVDVVVGIDEAGRGPVLGSLIYSAAFWPVSKHEEIQSLGFNDSKQLTESDRVDLFNEIISHPSIGWVVEELTAEHLSTEMLRSSPVSLNQISYDAVIKGLVKIQNAHPNPPQITDVFIDTVGDPKTYEAKLIQGLGNNFGRFIIEKKADAHYKVVSAASIIAKVVRDRLLADWAFEDTNLLCDKNFGSGYPGDEYCVKWLERSQNIVFGYPNIVRFSWSTSREALKKGIACSVSWECEVEDDSSAGTAEITSFYQPVGDKRPKRSAYFLKRKWKHVAIEELLV